MHRLPLHFPLPFGGSCGRMIWALVTLVMTHPSPTTTSTTTATTTSTGPFPLRTTVSPSPPPSVILIIRLLLQQCLVQLLHFDAQPRGGLLGGLLSGLDNVLLGLLLSTSEFLWWWVCGGCVFGVWWGVVGVNNMKGRGGEQLGVYSMQTGGVKKV